MPTLDPRIDAYIEKAAEFAQPILTHIRDLVHTACPDIEETIKWGAPFFDHKGVVCGMAAFKQHCALTLWKQKLLSQDAFPAEKTAMGGFGRITSLDDLPADDVMLGLICQAVKLNEDGVKVKAKPKGAKADFVVPDILRDALTKNKAAKTTFDNFSPSKQRDYVEWIDEAKTEATRQKRLATTIEQLAEGKARHWKYEKKDK